MNTSSKYAMTLVVAVGVAAIMTAAVVTVRPHLQHTQTSHQGNAILQMSHPSKTCQMHQDLQEIRIPVINPLEIHTTPIIIQMRETHTILMMIKG